MRAQMLRVRLIWAGAQQGTHAQLQSERFDWWQIATLRFKEVYIAEFIPSSTAITDAKGT